MINNNDILRVEEKATLLAKYKCEALSEMEEARLRQLADKNSRCQDIINMLSNDEFITNEITAMREIDTRKALAAVQKRIDASHAASQTFISFRMYRIASIILLLIALGTFVFYKEYTRVTPPDVPEAVQLAMQKCMMTGKHDANEIALTLSDYKNSIIDKQNKTQDESEPAVEPDKKGDLTMQLVQESLTKKQLLEARKITTNHDKEFWLTLEDGSLVHLNYNSRLIYPEKFGRGDRNVVLDGEAYFMVAKDRSRPFVVHLPDGEVKVFGTEFNVNTNNIEAGTNGSVIVLVKGSVSVSPTNGTEHIIKPGEKCLISHQSCQIGNVDIEPYVAWNQGFFCFDNYTLEHLMTILSHWYSLNVVFVTDEMRFVKFTGYVNRYESIEPAIRVIRQVTGLKIEIKNKTIYIGGNTDN